MTDSDAIIRTGLIKDLQPTDSDMTEKLKLSEISENITAHLRRFERDADINKRNNHGICPYYLPNASAAGRYVKIRYTSYHNSIHVTKAEAAKYLHWLNAGNVGKHHIVLKYGVNCA